MSSCGTLWSQTLFARQTRGTLKKKSLPCIGHFSNVDTVQCKIMPLTSGYFLRLIMRTSYYIVRVCMTLFLFF